jgi:primosomal protein N' (replication factor Y)
VESELKKMYPKARVLRADRDTTGAKKGFEKIYNDFREHKADILVGTQMIAKGLDIPNVNLVGVILADIGLHIPDFRSSERTFQLLTQVSGRAGRRDKRGQVIIQTYSPTHPAIVAASNHDYKKFFEEEIRNRKDFNFPPFSSIIKLTFTHPDKKVCYQTTKDIVEKLREIGEVSSAPATIPKLHGKYRWHIYLQGDEWVEKLRDVEFDKGWKIDRNPLQMG